MASFGSRSSVEQMAGLLLAVHWAIWMATVVHLNQKDLPSHDAFLLNVFTVGMLATSIGYIIRSGHLYALSIPLQIFAAYEFIYNYCCTSVYIFNGNWPEFVLSAYHMAMVSSLLLSDIYVSVSCTTAFLRTQKEREELRRRSPNASFITAFAQRLGSPPNPEVTETFRCRGASVSSIEDLFADYEAVDAVTLI